MGRVRDQSRGHSSVVARKGAAYKQPPTQQGPSYTRGLEQRNAELESKLALLKNEIKALRARSAESLEGDEATDAKQNDATAASSVVEMQAIAEEEQGANKKPSMTEYAVTYHERRHHAVEGWRGKLLEFMHSPLVQNTVVGLLLVDILCVVSEIVLEGAAHEGLHAPSVLEHVLHNTSFYILCVFLGEISLYIVAKGPRRFFSQPLEVLDLIVVIGSLYCDLHFHAATGQLLVLFRLWRLGRICHGVLAAQREILERKIRALDHQVAKLKYQLNIERVRGGNVPERPRGGFTNPQKSRKRTDSRKGGFIKGHWPWGGSVE